MATAYPSLTRTPHITATGPAYDPVIRSESEGGYEVTRARATRVRRQWTLSYTGLSAADKTALDGLGTTTGHGAGDITWTHPHEGTSHTVRLDGRIRFSEYFVAGVWATTFTLVEV